MGKYLPETKRRFARKHVRIAANKVTWSSVGAAEGGADVFLLHPATVEGIRESEVIPARKWIPCIRVRRKRPAVHLWYVIYVVLTAEYLGYTLSLRVVLHFNYLHLETVRVTE